jgi:broad specificity phosphatase PhoE
MTAQTWPHSLWLIRHGQSAGNVARDVAEASGAAMIEIAERDVDVPLSPLGVAQARALAGHVERLPAHERPTIVLTSPFARAIQTASAIAAVIGEPAVVDERLREKEFGALDRLTRAGITARFPAEVEARSRLGKFYHRPPSGESWCDVILRLRGVMIELQHNYPRERVLVVGHQVVVLCFRYLIERLDEQTLLAIDRAADVANGSITSYAYDAAANGGRGGLALTAYNNIEALADAGAPVTAASDTPRPTT